MRRKWEFMHDAVATIVRPLSATVFAAQVIRVAAMVGPSHWARWRMFDPGWIFWMNLGNWCAALAFVSLVVCLLLAVLRRGDDKGKLKPTGWCVGLNIATIGLLFFVPAVDKLI
jgi:hypothetical protein